MLNRARWTICLAFLITSIAYAIFVHGGDEPAESSFALLLVGAGALLGASFLFQNDFSRSQNNVDRGLGILALSFPAYVAFQLVPVPLGVLRIISPARASIADALAAVMPAQAFAPISISPPTTWFHLTRVAGYVLVFLVVRQVARRSSLNVWLPVVPLVVIGAVEAFWALSQPLAGIGVVSGTFFNKNHMAGLLEMILPFSLMSGFAVLHHGKHRGAIAASAALTACALFAAALAMLLAIGVSFSKMGYVSAVGSLLLMGSLALSRTPAGWQKRSAVTAMVVAAALTFVFITPAGVIEQFGTIVIQQTSEGRFPIWKDTMHLIAAYPLFGCGLGNFFPGLIPYQTSGVGDAWVNAHNDYLQLVSELGLLGALIPGVLLLTVFVRAFRAGRRGATEDARYLGLACVGGLTAILIHSLGDYNTYILSNALVLAWIAGIAGALPSLPGSARRTRLSAVRWEVRPAFRYLVMALGAVLGVYSAASLWYHMSPGGDRSTERRWCTIGICQPSFEAADGSSSMADLMEQLRRDPAGPYRWDDLGAALQAAGRTDTARHAFSTSLALGPNSPSTLMMAADFHFDVGDRPRAIALLSHAAEVSTGESDVAIFGTITYRKVAVETVLPSFVLNKRTSKAYLLELMAMEYPNDVTRLWGWMVQHGYADAELARHTTDFLVNMKQLELAWQAWTAFGDGKSEDFPKANRVFNGDFELDPSDVRFDWRIRSEAATIDFDQEIKHSGGRSLRIQFDGTKNPSEIGVQQEIYLRPGRYTFRAYVRTAGVSTNEGVGFRLRVDDPSAPLNMMVGHLRGSSDWTLVEQVFEVAGTGSLARLDVARKASLKFDNLIGGTVWVDRVSVVPIEP